MLAQAHPKMPYIYTSPCKDGKVVRLKIRPSDKVTQEYNVPTDNPWTIIGLSLDHPPSNVVATPLIQKYNVSMDYPWIIIGSSAIQCGSHPTY